MLDHFDVLAPFYERVIPPADPAILRDVLRLPTDGWLLDAGGGTGRASSPLRPLVGNLVVSDPSQPMLQQASARNSLHPVGAYSEGLPFDTASFDRVLVVDALHHFCDQRAAIADLLRVLKPGGRLVIEEPDIGTLPVKLIAAAEKLLLMRSHFYAPAQIQAMAEQLGAQARIDYKNRFEAWVVVDK